MMCFHGRMTDFSKAFFAIVSILPSPILKKTHELHVRFIALMFVYSPDMDVRHRKTENIARFHNSQSRSNAQIATNPQTKQ